MLKIYNSLTKQVEEIRPLQPGKVEMYTCGPTVYSYPTIGNWRTYVLSDLVLRALRIEGFEVDSVMNMTDVGHLTGDNLGDADTGEDRLEKAAAKEKKTAWGIAKYYGEDFVDSFGKLNLVKPLLFSKATDHIKEQIDLVQRIEKAGFAYRIADGIYFDVAEYEKKGNIYGKLSNLEEIKPGARVEINTEKRDQRDFALWKFSPAGAKRDMEWESPWGMGFPGWHIECSAMSMKYLGDQLDIHVGGEDLKSTHHPNEIAQSESVTGKKPFVRYWMHGAFLLVDGGRMGKSLGNAYTLHDIIEKGYSPMALRYYYLSAHYRKQMNFSWEGMEGVSNSYKKLKKEFLALRVEGGQDKNIFGNKAEVELSGREAFFRDEFVSAVEDDLNMSAALAVARTVLKDEKLNSFEKRRLVENFDKVFGLKLAERDEVPADIPAEVMEMVNKREEMRKTKQWAESDALRKEIEAKGYKISDFFDGVKVEKI
ncbi:cysteine--tRNA ligase [Candidatus Collierbacteria bacterium RIFOXYB2_FULL_46_14]|nr:MAG: cysteine--tRNA ligase [Candidatus Collierbacteria bacterium RIFOXYB2_FULL_46_14]OGD76724.1 MAG: cysteine--tRNA ligase [Candidatus Collierbacteria bacterium RIFOXYA2_FULL_46_20]OGD78060.1 MAG: cysteine--tRNA ligase [Candidatus Collierbacteria bacterium RIFOXYC2_FULL_43_15]OGD81258.1 MAG: cysteine--tRNA ligase [Pseudomonadales bacterium GWC2_63_15]OGD82782.1 MAG: cysteine--tRNA ligase [Candidatus Collierbacteria bacterium RIFOXYD2_FULL_45_13]